MVKPQFSSAQIAKVVASLTHLYALQHAPGRSGVRIEYSTLSWYWSLLNIAPYLGTGPY